MKNTVFLNLKPYQTHSAGMQCGVKEWWQFSRIQVESVMKRFSIIALRILKTEALLNPHVRSLIFVWLVPSGDSVTKMKVWPGTKEWNLWSSNG